MKPVIIAATVLTLSTCLGGCITPAQMAASDDATCQSYGYTPGQDGYGQCRMNIAQARQRATLALMGQMQQIQQNQQQNYNAQMQALAASRAAAQAQRPVNCTTTYVGQQAYTNCN